MPFPHGDGDELPRDARVVEVELADGESVRIGDRVCTVVEVEPGVVHLRVDAALPADTPPGSARFAAVAR